MTGVLEWIVNYWKWHLVAVGIGIVVAVVRDKIITGKVTTKKKDGDGSRE